MIKKPRKKFFNFPYLGDIKIPKYQTLRHNVMLRLKEGAFFEDIVEEVKKFDASRNVQEKNVERRA